MHNYDLFSSRMASWLLYKLEYSINLKPHSLLTGTVNVPFLGIPGTQQK